jgi:beta-galactosidase
MVHQLYNHPSIAWWGLFNELRKSLNPSVLINQLKADINGIDATRNTVGASNLPDATFAQIPDAPCRNTYPGWYGLLKADEKSEANQMSEVIDDVYKEFGNRRFALSEYGAGANTAQHMEGAPKVDGPYASFHPEEYQALVHEIDYAAIKNNPKLWGSFIWVMFDFASYGRHEGDTLGMNDKGLVTQDRQIKKDAYLFYKANWSTDPMVAIACRLLTPRQQAVTEVKVYSNCDVVELKVNGISLGKGSKNEVNVFHWHEVILQKGPNAIQAIGQINGQTVTDQCEWISEKAANLLDQWWVKSKSLTLSLLNYLRSLK